MKQIIYAWNYLQWGGAQIHLFALIREVKKEFDVLIVLPVGSDEQLIKFIRELDVRYEFYETELDVKPAPGLIRKIQRHFNKMKSEYQMLRFLEKFELEKSLVHIEISPWQSLLSLIWLSLRTDVFITMHNSLPEVSKFRHFLWKIKLRIISHFKTFHPFASNYDSKNYFKGLYSDNTFENTVVTYTSVDPNEVKEALEYKIDRKKLLVKYNLPDDKFLYFCVGQFIDRKGRWTFLEAARELHKNNKDVAFVWIANSKPSDEDLKQAENYGLGDNFIFITSDQVGDEHIDLFKLLKLADVFALVSFQEGLPISLLEAMALGIPSISTNVNAIPEAVKHLETGWLIEAGDSMALTEAFQTLKNDENLRRKLSVQGHEFVLEKFNDQVVAKIALETYQKVLAK
jgi:glycosyltransferase involved in cell wall biosynthesis